jgi:predicted nucleotidyltransferase
LIAPERIQAYCDAVALEFRPQRIVLFGSYAYGEPTPDSDVDLLVILPFRGSDVPKAVQIRSRFDAPFPLDVLVRKPGFIAQRLRERDMLIEMVMTQGRVVYEGACTKAEARRVLKTCRAFRKEARPCLGLPPK